MAVIGVWSGWGLLRIVNRTSNSRAMQFVTVALCGWVSMQAAAIACASELLISGHQSLLVTKLCTVHAVIGLGEAFLAVAACAAVSATSLLNRGSAGIQSISQSTMRLACLAILVCAVAAVALSPWASSLPDGLEWTLSQSGLAQDASSANAWQLADYKIPGWGESLMSLWLAGMIGVAVVIASTWGATFKQSTRRI